MRSVVRHSGESRNPWASPVAPTCISFATSIFPLTPPLHQRHIESFPDRRVALSVACLARSSQ